MRVFSKRFDDKLVIVLKDFEYFRGIIRVGFSAHSNILYSVIDKSIENIIDKLMGYIKDKFDNNDILIDLYQFKKKFK